MASSSGTRPHGKSIIQISDSCHQPAKQSDSDEIMKHSDSSVDSANSAPYRSTDETMTDGVLDEYLFGIDQHCEVMGSTPEYIGSFYPAIVKYVEVGYNYHVKFKTLFDEEDPTKNRTTVIPEFNLRPVPPHLEQTRYKWGDIVDCLRDGGYWRGHISDYDKIAGMYKVFFKLKK